MSSAGLFRGFFALLFGGVAAYGLFLVDARDRGEEPPLGRNPRYGTVIPPLLLPLFLVWLLIVGLFKLGPDTTGNLMLSICFSIFLHIALYYALLCLLLPLLRRWLSARACAVLWLLPNFLYITQQSFMALPEPRWVVRLPGAVVWAAAAVWALGFAVVLLGSVLSHFRFRHRLLEHSAPVFNGEIQSLWEQAQRSVGYHKAPYRLIYSAAVDTPLSIGFFRRSIRVVLPRRDYTTDELELIFRHELIHISRGDASTKFFLIFCTAMCWFNPLMWLAMRRSAEDLELSCDETVLLDADLTTRRRYADLLLRTAGDSRGYTTCLSASARALHYRLEHVLRPRCRILGSLVVGLVFFGLILSCGHVALAYGSTTGEELLFSPHSPSDFSVSHISLHMEDGYHIYSCTDDRAMTTYLSGLELSRLTGSYAQPDSDEMGLVFQGPDGVVTVTLMENRLQLTRLYEDYRVSEQYFYAQAPDWNYLNSLLTVEPQTAAEVASTPQLLLYFRGAEDMDLGNEPIHAYGHLISRIDEDGVTTTYDAPAESGVGGVSGFPVTEVQLEFTCNLPFSRSSFFVMVEHWDGTFLYSVQRDDLEDPTLLPLADCSAHYTLYGNFSFEDGTTLNAEYCFDVELPPTGQETTDFARPAV